MNKYCVRDNYTLFEVIESFQKNHDRVACVLNSNEKIIGVVSQGDIIRALCDGVSMRAKVDKIIRSSFIFLKERDLERAYTIFKKEKITMLPIVDDDFRLVSVITLIDIFEYIESR